MQTTPKSHTSHPTNPNRKPFHKPYQTNNKSLLQKLTSHQPNSTQTKPHSGKLIIAKLGDFVSNKCVFGINCAHLRAQAECLFLHQKKDFEALGMPLPEKYLENEEPLKKSKQERKEDKIKEKAEREKRLKEKQEQVEERQNNRNNQQQEKQKQEKEQVPLKKAQQKIMDQKQLIVQKMLKPTKQGQPVTFGQIYQQLNLIASAICKNTPNPYSQQFNIPSLNLTLHELRKRLVTKFKKNKQFETVQKQMAEKQCGLVKKVIKNVAAAYKEMVEEVGESGKWKNVDLRSVQETFTSDDVKRVINLKKDHQQFLQYFQNMVDEDIGYPVSFEPQEQQGEDSIQLNKGNLVPLTNLHLLPIIISPTSPRLFLSTNTSHTHLRALSQFFSLMIPHQVVQKSLIQKTFVIDILATTYRKFVTQLMEEFLNDYHEKMKGPGKEFEFGKMEENLKKYRGFLAKYKAKVASVSNNNNSFVLVVYNVKKFVEKIQALGLGELLDYDKIKKDRTMEEEQLYEKVFLLREFINIMNEGGQGQNFRVVYVTPQKKFKPKNHKAILENIDKFLVHNQQEQKEKQQ